MNKSWIYRDYQPGDEWQIIKLFKRVFGQDISLPTWKWRFIENPSGKGIIKLMFDEDKLIGHYAVTPMAIQIARMPVKAVLSMTTMTHPDYSGHGIFTFLAEEVFKQCIQDGFSLVYGFPNNNSYPGFTRKLGWDGLGKTVTLFKLPDEAYSDISIKANVECLERFDNRIDLLWDNIKNEYSVIVPRVERYLNWRFVQNPDVKYENYVLTDQHGQILGYTVLKQHIQDKVEKGHIVDMLSLNDKEIIKILIRHACTHFQNKQISYISAWFPANSHYYSAMKDEGFREVESGQNFGVKMFDKTFISVPATIRSLKNWYLTMSDSDVF